MLQLPPDCSLVFSPKEPSSLCILSLETARQLGRAAQFQASVCQCASSPQLAWVSHVAVDAQLGVVKHCPESESAFHMLDPGMPSSLWMPPRWVAGSRARLPGCLCGSLNAEVTPRGRGLPSTALPLHCVVQFAAGDCVLL